MDVRPSQLFAVTKVNATNPQTRYRPGQFVMGTVLKWLGKDQASVSIGGQTLIANLENTLQTGTRYPFQVLKEEPNGTLHLKVMNAQPESGNNLVLGMLRQMGVAVTPQSSHLLTQMMANNWPIVPSFVKQALKLTKRMPSSQEAFSVLEEVVARDLPLSPSVFKSVQMAKFGPSAEALLSQLEDSLQRIQIEPKQEAASQGLKQVLGWFQTGSETEPLPLPQLLEKMGFFHEAMIAKWVKGVPVISDVEQGAPLLHQKEATPASEEWRAITQAMTDEQKEVLNSIGDTRPVKQGAPVQDLKGALLSFLNSQQGVGHSSTGSLHVADQLLHQITGQQLLSLTHNPEWLSFNVQIPIFNQEQASEAKVKWEIKKTPDGAFDPEFCRLVFHVNLTHLKETVLQMVIQNRALTCTLYTEQSPSNNLLASQTFSEMKERLHALNYELISFQHRKEPVQGVVEKLFYQTTQMDVTI